MNRVTLQFTIPKYSPLASKYNINNKTHGRHLRARAVIALRRHRRFLQSYHRSVAAWSPVVARLAKHKTFLNTVKHDETHVKHCEPLVKHREPLVKHHKTLLKHCETS